MEDYVIHPIYLDFDEGYWLDEQVSWGMPSSAGIYAVHECVHNPEKRMVRPIRLLYVGKARDARTRIAGHEKWPRWHGECRERHRLCFSFGRVSILYAEDPELLEATILRAEHALIQRHQPPCNDKLNFTHPETRVILGLRSKIGVMDQDFTVWRA